MGFPDFFDVSHVPDVQAKKEKLKFLKFSAFFVFVLICQKTGCSTAEFYQISPKQNSKLPMVIVDHSHFEVLLIIGDSSGVRVPGTLWV